MKLSRILCLLAALTPVLHAQVPISASNVTDSFNVKVLSARLCFTPVNAAMQPSGFRVGSQQVIPNEVCGTVSSGVLQSGKTVAPTAAGIYYHVYLKAPAANTILRDYGMAQILGPSWSLDGFDPSMAILPVSTITMGTVTTLPAGTGASCTISGSSPYLLNCGIPQGVQGPAGTTTAAGANGDFNVPGIFTNGSFVTGVSSYAAYQRALTACGTNPCYVSVTGTVAFSSNYTVPNNVIMYAAGGLLQTSSGVTVTFGAAQPVIPNGVQFFTGAGSIAGLTVSRPEWFGSTSLLTAYSALTSNGGKIPLSNAVYQSNSTSVTKPNVTIEGAGQAQYNSGSTAFVSGTGTIIQGAVGATSGANNLTLKGFSLDVGSALGAHTNGLSITSNGIGNPTIYDVTVDHVSVLLNNPTDPYHPILIENVNRGSVTNVQTRFGIYGVVLKCQNCRVEHLIASGESNSCVIVKSDATYAIASHVTVHDVKCSSYATVGDTGGVAISGYGAYATDITIDQASFIGTSVGVIANATTDGTNGGFIINTAASNIHCTQVQGPCGWLTESTTGATSMVDNTTVTNVNVWNNVGDAFSVAINTGYTAFSNVNVFSATGNAFTNAAAGTQLSNFTCAGTIGGVCLNSGGYNLYVSNALNWSNAPMSAGSVILTSGYAANGIFQSSGAMTVSALSTATAIPGTGANRAALRIGDNTSGGTCLLTIDPNSGAQLMGASCPIPGLAASGITYSGGHWNVTLTSGAVPRALVYSIF